MKQETEEEREDRLKKKREWQRQWRKDFPEKSREASRKWEAENPEKLRARRQRDNLKHKERRNKTSREWRERNRERVKKSAASYRANRTQDQKDKIKEASRSPRAKALREKWAASNRDKILNGARMAWKARSKSWRESDPTSYYACILLSSARSRAKQYGLAFSVNKDRIKSVLDAGVCEVTGLAFDITGPQWKGPTGRGRPSPWSPSLDRIDRSLGYTDANTRVVVWAYNTSKNLWSDADVMVLAKAIVASEAS